MDFYVLTWENILVQTSTTFDGDAFVTADRPWVFISWSGDVAERLAQEMRSWIPKVIQTVRPFVSHDIRAGTNWHQVLSQKLDGTSLGIVCLTPQNLDAPWLLFESGALAKALDEAVVCPYLLGVSQHELPGPLSHLQAVVATKDGTTHLIKSINDAVAAKLGDTWRLDDGEIDNAVDSHWSSLEQTINCLNRTLREEQESETETIVGPDKRTRRLIEDLNAMGTASGDRKPKRIMYSGFLSSFAISEADIDLLQEEKQALEKLATEDFNVKCIISPPGMTKQSEDIFDPDAAIRRLNGLLDFLNCDSAAHKNIDWCISPFRQKNLFILGTDVYYEGFKKGRAIGYDVTLRQQRPRTVMAHIDAYEELWKHLSASPDGGPILRHDLVKSLSKCQKRLNQTRQGTTKSRPTNRVNRKTKTAKKTKNR